MDQIRIGKFLAQERKKKHLTQEQLADRLSVSTRTISRWETGRSLPDFDLMIELARMYDLAIEEILDGSRKDSSMNRQTEETLYKIAEVNNKEKEQLLKRINYFAIAGVISGFVFFLLDINGLADSGWTEDLASLALGLTFGSLLVAILYSSRYIKKISAFKKRLLHRI